MRIVQEEVFGPVVTVETFRTEDEAVELANDTRYGLAAGVWTGEASRAQRVAARLRHGTVWINDFHPYLPQAEWGGYGQSGVGRELGPTGLREYQEIKHIYQNLSPGPPAGSRAEGRDGMAGERSVTDEPEYDYVIVGGGTAGCVLAARLTEDPDCRVCVIEGGPSDVGDERILRLRNWINLLGSEFDYGYTTVEQPRGNSHILHSRARVLGGCSSHNTVISFLPLPEDLDDWVDRGCTGWGPDVLLPYRHRLQNRIVPVADKDRNPIARDFVTAAASALGVPVIEDFNARPFAEGAGFFSLAYEPESNRRSSASVAYLHPVLDRPNLTLRLETWAYGLLPDGDGRLTRVQVRQSDGTTATVRAARDMLLCAGAIDTPRLLLLSGVGPAQQLRDLGIEVRADVPGVGENLLDHPESVIVWETHGPLPRTRPWTRTRDCSCAALRAGRART